MPLTGDVKFENLVWVWSGSPFYFPSFNKQSTGRHLKTMQIFCSSKFHSRFNLMIILAQFLNFQPQNSFHIHQVTSFCTEDTSFFYYRYHQFIDSCFSMAYIIHYCSYLGLKTVPNLASGSPIKLMPISHFEQVLTF